LQSGDAGHFSQRSRHFRLTQSEKDLGIDIITDEALQEMKAHLTLAGEGFEAARVEEKRRRHVVVTAGISKHGEANKDVGCHGCKKCQ
jgi:hypothetical protein